VHPVRWLLSCSPRWPGLWQAEGHQHCRSMAERVRWPFCFPKEKIVDQEQMAQPLQNLRVYVINLDRRPDRWEMAQKTLKRAGFTRIERVSAVDGKRIDSRQLDQLLVPDVRSRLGQTRQRHEDLGSVGAVGCYLSHYQVWNIIMESNEPAIVVEDDILCHPLLNEFHLAKNSQPLNDYDFVLLAATLREPHLLPADRNPQGVYPYHGLFWELHFYYLTPAGAQFFAAGALPLEFQVDSYMAFKMKKYPEFRSGVHVPNMASQSDSTTDIQTLMTANLPFSQVWIYIHRHNHSTLMCHVLYWFIGAMLFYLVAKGIQHVAHVAV